MCSIIQATTICNALTGIVSKAIKEEFENGMKYKKDSFRLVTPRKDDFSNIDMWWREDRRHFSFPLGVHQLQNLHLDMTKVPLEKPMVK